MTALELYACSAVPEPSLTNQLLSEFRPVNEDVISGYMYINNLCNKSCSLDPIPSSVFQRWRHELVPVITRIVNLSLQSGQVPDRSFKAAVIKPLLKKSGANHENFAVGLVQFGSPRNFSHPIISKLGSM